MSDLPDGYYAVPDPDGPTDPGVDDWTFWRVRYGGIQAYPKGAKYGPVFLRKDAPADREERDLWMQSVMDYRLLWNARVREAIEADPMAARRQFAENTARCCDCGRRLTDGTSRLLGIGPDCRDRLPHDLLMAYLAEVKRAQALSTTQPKEN